MRRLAHSDGEGMIDEHPVYGEESQSLHLRLGEK